MKSIKYMNLMSVIYALILNEFSKLRCLLQSNEVPKQITV